MYHAPAARQLGQLHVRKDEIPESYPKGRVCARPRCSTELCIWNPGPICWPCGGYETVDVQPTMEALLDLIESNGT